MLTAHDILYVVGDSVQWDGYDYVRDQYGEISGITDGTHTLYVTADDSIAVWTLTVAEDDGYSVLEDGATPLEDASDLLTALWAAYTAD